MRNDVYSTEEKLNNHFKQLLKQLENLTMKIQKKDWNLRIFTKLYVHPAKSKATQQSNCK